MSAIIGTAFYWTRIVFREFTKNENHLQQKGEKIMSTHKKSITFRSKPIDRYAKE